MKSTLFPLIRSSEYYHQRAIIHRHSASVLPESDYDQSEIIRSRVSFEPISVEQDEAASALVGFSTTPSAEFSVSRSSEGICEACP